MSDGEKERNFFQNEVEKYRDETEPLYLVVATNSSRDSPPATVPRYNMCWGRRLPSSEKLAKPCRTLRNLLQMLCISPS